MIEVRKKGRKPKHLIEVLRTIVWVEYAKQQTNKKAFSVETMVRGKSTQPLEKLNRWNRYENGKHTPRTEYLDKVDFVIPGSKAVFKHVLWDVLSSFNRTQDEINDLIQRLEPEVKFQLISRLKVEPIKRKPFNEYVVESLTRIGSIDCLVVAILMIQESIFLGSEKLRELALELYAGLTEKIAQNPLFFSIHPELFDYIDKTFKHYIFLAPNIRLTAVIFWQSYRDNLWSEEMKQKSEILEASKRVTPNKETSPKTRIESSEMPSYFD